MVDAAAERDLWFVTYSRPGYGDSARRPDRTVAHCTEDVVDITKALAIDLFVTAGWSGGGPHALACAALLPDRVQACATIAGVAPYPAEGLDWLAGMGRENVEEFGAAVAGGAELRAYHEEQALALADVTADQVAEALGDLIPEVDRAALTGEFAEFMAADFRKAVGNGIWGWFDDDLAFVRDWGFELGAIRVPVTVWQGSDDRMVPFAHGQWLAAHVPDARARLSDGHGHLSLIASFGEILDDLLERAGR
jgi:pimeloyl-ACP methyl ester carboxylesterase